ncbi:MAG TPA: NADH-quinone oxidoreductase subunit NuoE [Candidatus Angelobacter sp.]|jgi:NADH-quinone oxidoreductase subunit E|nr:NADH-quinone oxidoreductase subunit NuoE [Candidatus Angelobacter sp.]
MSLSETTRQAIERHRDRYPQAKSAILPCLWEVQHEQGWVTAEGMELIAEVLGVAPSEVQAVATFYSMYFQKPPGRHSLLVCVNVACSLRGADETAAYIEKKMGTPPGTTTADGAFTWDATIECLGGCGYAPMMQIDHHFHEHLTPERIDRILDTVGRQPGPHEPHPAPPPRVSGENGGTPPKGRRAAPPNH